VCGVGNTGRSRVTRQSHQSIIFIADKLEGVATWFKLRDFCGARLKRKLPLPSGSIFLTASG
ncbi:hypothetical protein BgiBS90_011904, partial [Biomphalaria glabrata]